MEYPYLKALLNDARDVFPTWSFDEQQADPIHNQWDWKRAKEELGELLKQSSPDLRCLALHACEYAVGCDGVPKNHADYCPARRK